MAVEVNFETDVLKKKVSETLEGAVVETLEQMKEDIEPYVPYDTGELNDSAIIDESSLSIVWEAEHAEYVYDMPESNDFNQTVNTKATSHWVEEAMSSYRDKWIELLQKIFYKRW